MNVPRFPNGKPEKIIIGKETFRPAVFRIESFDESGRPESLTYISDETTIELSRDVAKNQFAIAYVSERTFLING